MGSGVLTCDSAGGVWLASPLAAGFAGLGSGFSSVVGGGLAEPPPAFLASSNALVSSGVVREGSSAALGSALSAADELGLGVVELAQADAVDGAERDVDLAQQLA